MVYSGLVKNLLVIYFCFGCVLLHAQLLSNLVLRGDYSYEDSIQITNAYLNAYQAVENMCSVMDSIWNVDDQSGQDKRALREKNWKNEDAFMHWLGGPEKMEMARRRIKRIHSKYKRKMILKVTKQNKGRCRGWISAWAIPFGKVKIRLCDDYLKYRTHLNEKTLIHELGHEAGMPFHRKIHGCWAAQRAAKSSNNIAKRSPENYAWLAMSYTGLDCSR